MANNDFVLKQNLKLSLNGNVKNFVPEYIDGTPPEEELVLGRIWFNTQIGNFQTVRNKIDSDGNPIPGELEVVLLGSDELGFTRDGEYYPDGLFNFTINTKVADAVDEINEALKDIAPANASPLHGDILLNENPITMKLSGLDNSDREFRITSFQTNDEIPVFNIQTISGNSPTKGYYEKGAYQEQFGNADQGIFKLFLNDEEIDNVDLGNNFYEPSRELNVVQGYDAPIYQYLTNQDGTVEKVLANPNKDNFIGSNEFLIINKIEKYNDFKKWQKGTASFNLSLVNGENNFYLGHTTNIENTTNTTNVFFNPNQDSVTIEDFSFSTYGDYKVLSGIPYLNQNIQNNVSAKLLNLFKYTYFDVPLEISSDVSTKKFIWNDSNFSLADKEYPNFDDELVIDNFKIDFDEINYVSDNLTITIKGTNNIGASESSITQKILIDTYSDISTLLDEYFVSETYRLPTSTNSDDLENVESNKGKWNSEKLLEEGEAQVAQGILKQANQNYEEYGLDTDYTDLANSDQVYYRFIQSNNPNSNGEIFIKTYNNLNDDFDAFIKLPGITGWLDLSKPFDVEDFNNNYKSDGTGCSTGIEKVYNGYNLKWTVGTNSTNDTNNQILIKIVIKNDVKIYQISEISDGWRS